MPRTEVAPRRERALLASAGVLLLIGAAVAPSAWYQPLLATPKEPLVSGWTLLRLVLLVEGAVLIALAALGVTYRRLPETSRLSPTRPLPASPASESGGRTRLVAVALVAITALAVALRLYHLNTDLWFDEITSVVRYGTSGFTQIFTTYESTNNHLLNSWLIALTTSLAGYEEWAIRLPAVVAGVAAIPAMYWVARRVFSPAYGLAAALLIAVSYHHIYFSQNARGYSAYMLFGLLAAGLLVRALETDRARDWALFVGADVLAAASHLTAVFVVAGQIGAAAVAVLLIRRQQARGRPLELWPLARRIVCVFVTVGALLLVLYAPAIPQALALVDSVYSTAGSGYQPISGELFRELLLGFTSRGLVGIALVPAVLLGAVGAVSLFRRAPVLLLAMSLGPFVHFALAVVGGLTFSPRFFLSLLFPVVALTLETFRVVAGWLEVRWPSTATNAGRRRAAWPSLVVPIVGVLCVAAVFTEPLRYYYSVPKQPYRAPLAFIREAHPGSAIVAIYLADAGLRYYGVAHPKDGVPPLVVGKNLFLVRSRSALAAAERQARGEGKPVVLVTTLERGTELDFPRLAALVEERYRRERAFGASIGGGEVTVWVPR